VCSATKEPRRRGVPVNTLSPLFWTWLGAGLIALVAGRLLFNAWAAIRHGRLEARRRELEIARLTGELAAAREARQKRTQETGPWNGYRKFVVQRRVEEADHVCSFHLVPHDAKPLPPFKPGQYLTFRLAGAGREGGQLIRCYSLSDHPHQPYYRVTIKRVLPPAGVGAGGAGSTLFHAQVKERDILDVRAPSGHFFIDPHDPAPVVLIGGGIGVTPIYSMLATLVHLKGPRPVWVYYGVRNRREHVFRAELAAIAREHRNVRLRICYSQPGAEDRPGEDYHIAGRITPELLRRELPSNNFAFYYCGPGLMMEALTAGLKDWGVPESHLHFEAFGPLSVKRVNQAIAGAPAPAKHSVVFRKTGTTVPWDESQGTVLDLAEQAGINIPSGCRTGNCGTCVVAMQSGEVTYIQPPGTSPEARTCLACIAQPKGDLVLDA
jgi:ferredoxin-NADP reductase